MANFEVFHWNYSLNTNPKIVRSSALIKRQNWQNPTLICFRKWVNLAPIYWQQQQLYQQHTTLDDDMHRALARFRKMIQNSFVVPNYGSARFNFLRIKRWSRSFYLTEFITSWNCNVGISATFFLSRYSLFCSMIALLNYYARSLNRTASIFVQNVCFTTLVGICWWAITHYDLWLENPTKF